MTAKHVVIEYLKSIAGVDFSQGIGIKGEFSFLIYMCVSDTAGQPVVFGVTQIYYSGLTDIALLRMKIEEGKTWESLAKFPALQLLPPKIGESDSIPQVFGDSHWIEVAVIGALLIAAFSAGAFAFVKIYGVFT